MKEVTEQELAAKAVAPRVTMADIEDNISSEVSFVVGDALKDCPVSESTKLLTICVLTMKNGFTVTGESACASPANFNADIGRRIAREHAVEKIWPLMGYALREKLAAVENSSFLDRLGIELKETAERLDKLTSFMLTDAFMGLPPDARLDLREQLDCMTPLVQVLWRRYRKLSGADAV